jgi:hypothetical protein
MWSMTTVTADDIRVLAQSGAEDPVLLLVDGQVRVVPAGAVTPGTPGDVLYTRAELVTEVGEEITDVEAETLAAGLTARLA